MFGCSASLRWMPSSVVMAQCLPALRHFMLQTVDSDVHPPCLYFTNILSGMLTPAFYRRICLIARHFRATSVVHSLASEQALCRKDACSCSATFLLTAAIAHDYFVLAPVTCSLLCAMLSQRCQRGRDGLPRTTAYRNQH